MKPVTILLFSDASGASYAVPLTALESYRLPVSADSEVAVILTQLADQEVSGYGDPRMFPNAGLFSFANGAELNVIRMQSLISQRQMDVQLTTNLLKSLDDTVNKVMDNIGH